MKRNCLAILLFFVIVKTIAQNPDYPWLIGVGTHGAQMTIGDEPFWREYFTATKWNVVPAAGQARVYRYLAKSFSVGTTLAVGSALRYPFDKKEGTFLLDWDVNIKYSFSNGYILSKRSWFDPYLLMGGGLCKWGDLKGTIDVGAGLNLWIVHNFGLFIESKYNYIPHRKITPQDANPRPSYMHHQFGVVARFGRGKDSDKDGVPDVEDRCPHDPGKPALGGCPDTDDDGIADKDDKCPLENGAAANEGCPDTDGDGVLDREDLCPTSKGPIEKKGCPDSDGDGLADNEDNCPTEIGTATAKGCPDSDTDGVLDKDDECPTLPGLAKFGGCPDTDGDGLEDRKDKCPNVFGMEETNGCPKPALNEEQKTAVQKQLNFAAQNIFFEVGKDVLKYESYDDLRNVVSIMEQYKFLKLSIEGHTDNSGNEEKNLDLSSRRAAAVVNFLRSKGISPTRMNAIGYGPYKPIATNATAAGKARNRRVEIHIKE